MHGEGIAAPDIDRDGRPDIPVAELHQGANGGEMGIYFNDGDRREKQVIATTGSHDIHAADLDGDDEIDLRGANRLRLCTPIDGAAGGGRPVRNGRPGPCAIQVPNTSSCNTVATTAIGP